MQRLRESNVGIIILNDLGKGSSDLISSCSLRSTQDGGFVGTVLCVWHGRWWRVSYLGEVHSSRLREFHQHGVRQGWGQGLGIVNGGSIGEFWKGKSKVRGYILTSNHTETESPEPSKLKSWSNMNSFGTPANCLGSSRFLFQERLHHWQPSIWDPSHHLVLQADLGEIGCFLQVSSTTLKFSRIIKYSPNWVQRKFLLN